MAVYLKASAPIPVGGASLFINPTSMLMGWLVGRQVATMRGKPTENITRLISFDGHILQDVNGVYLLPKESE